jgi:16S rRNA (guanine1207-N2)-methyltransferase
MPDRNQEDLVETLLLPFAAHLQWPQRALFLRARHAHALRTHDLSALTCEQTFKPHADELQQAGLRVLKQVQEPSPLVLVLPPRQRDEARALLARAVSLTGPEGYIVACQHNDEGARSMEADLRKLVGEATTLSKNHCRVCWASPRKDLIDASLLGEWLSLDAPRRIADQRFMSRPGIFAWDRIDIASQLLADHLPRDLAGSVADLGAGFGYLSAELLERCAGVRSLHLYEAEARALDLAEHNLAAFKARVDLNFLWHDVSRGLLHTYDVIVTNPPFHTSDRHDRPDIGRRFIAVAAAALKPRGQLWLVANRHLPYETVLGERFGRVRQVASSQGFKVIEAVKGT